MRSRAVCRRPTLFSLSGFWAFWLGPRHWPQSRAFCLKKQVCSSHGPPGGSSRGAFLEPPCCAVVCHVPRQTPRSGCLPPASARRGLPGEFDAIFPPCAPVSIASRPRGHAVPRGARPSVFSHVPRLMASRQDECVPPASFGREAGFGARRGLSHVLTRVRSLSAVKPTVIDVDISVNSIGPVSSINMVRPSFSPSAVGLGCGFKTRTDFLSL